MKYTKPPLTFFQQAQILKKRGLIAEEEDIIEKLKAVNYYRLSGYWLPFKKNNNTFKSEGEKGQVSFKGIVFVSRL
jgi:abortive infection bacteriophage resistance protein